MRLPFLKPRQPLDMPLSVPRLRLWPLQGHHVEALHWLMNDPDLKLYQDRPAFDDMAVTAAVVRDRVVDQEGGLAVYWLVERDEAEAAREAEGAGDALPAGPLGAVQLEEVDRRGRRAVMDLSLSRALWTGDLALDLVQAVIAHARGQGVRLLSARTHVGEVRSERLLRRLRFDQTGYLRGDIQPTGERRDRKTWARMI